MSDFYFHVGTKLGVRMRVTATYWNFIITAKHTIMKGRENDVKDALEEPDEIRRSIRDRTVFLYYKQVKDRFIAVVCKHINGEGYIITTYITDRIKIGEQIWKRQR